MTESFYDACVPVLEAARDRLAMEVPAGAEDPARRLSWGDLLDLAGRLAACLEAREIRAGDRLLMQMPKCPEGAALYLACLQRGVIFVPLNTAYTLDELRYFVDDAAPALLVCAPESVEACAALTPAVAGLGAGAQGDLGAELAGAETLAAAVRRQPSDPAAILYTSGTTGRAKGAVLSHGNLLSNARTLLDAWGWRDDDVLLHALPIFHAHGLFVALNCALLRATPMLFLPRFDAAGVAELLPRCTVMMGVPTFYSRLLEQAELDAAACAGVRLFVSGSAPLTEQTFEAWEARTGQRILERYGMSETLMNTSNPLEGERRAGTVGFALPGIEVRVTGEDGGALPAGEAGSVEVRGPNVFLGYWGMPEQTAREFRDGGWFVTGDLGRLDEAGRLTLVGRAKDLIISGGYNVYPKEVETVLDALPAVRESAVIGVPHDDFGEAVVAVLVPAAEPVEQGELDAALAGRLARYKQPKAVVNLGELPRNTMGKVQKNRLREDYRTLFAAD